MLWRCGCDLGDEPGHTGECCPRCLAAAAEGKASPQDDGFCCCRDERRSPGLERHEVAAAKREVPNPR